MTTKYCPFGKDRMCMKEDCMLWVTVENREMAHVSHSLIKRIAGCALVINWSKIIDKKNISFGEKDG